MKTISAKVSVVILFLIILLGGLLRFYRLPELTTFLSDQAIELGSTADILNGNPTLIGIKTSNSEIRNGAVMYYLLAPLLYLFNFDPIAGGVLQTLLSLGAIILTYLICKEFLANKFALFTSFIVAVSPQLVLFSRQTLLAYYPLFFSTLIFYLAIKTVKVPSSWKIILLGTLAGFSLQIHYSMLVWVGVVLTLPLLFPKAKIQSLLLLIIGLIIGLAPMLAFELRNEFFNTKMLIEFIGRDKVSSESFNIIYYLWNSLNVYLPLGAIVAFSAACGYFISAKNTVTKIAILSIVWELIFIFLLVREDPSHYLLPVLVPIIILFASLLNRFKASNFILIILGSIVFFWSISRYGLSANSGWTMEEGWDLNGVKKASQIIISDVQSPNFNVVMLMDSENQAMPVRYFLNRAGKPAQDIGLYPVTQTLYVVAPNNLDLTKVQTWEVTSFGPFTISKNWPIQNNYVLYKLDHLVQ